MILITSILGFGILANFGLGIASYLTNRTRTVNQAYLISSTFLSLWLLSNLFILHSTDVSQAIININISTAVSACIPSTFQLLRLTIKFPEASWPQIFRRAYIQLLINAIIIGLCFTPNFTKSAHFPATESDTVLVQPDYGILFIFFVLYLTGSIAVLAYNLFHDRKNLRGSQRLELEFLGFACLSGSVVAILGTVITLILKSANSVPITNALCVFTISIIAAYGVTVHRILTVSTLLRKLVAYALLCAYLSLIYFVVYAVVGILFEYLFLPQTYASHFIATLVVVFSMIPARNRMERTTDLLFANSKSFDVQETMKKANTIFQSVSTIKSLQTQFSELLLESFKATSITILETSTQGYSQCFPETQPSQIIKLPVGSALVQKLEKDREPLSSESLSRVRISPAVREIIETLHSNKADLASGAFQKSALRSIVLINGQVGRIYDKTEQDALQILCNQFAVALENAQLYTEVQDSKIQNEIMLDQLASGVVVANPEREITLFNHEAQKITGISEENAIGQNIAILPREIYLALEVTLENQNGVRNIDASIYPEEGSEESGKNIRMGSAFLFGHDGKPMGALLVFTDITELKALEEQVRRSDQLSSVGTLAAGMAHEIKNPLVTIKTFTQLLPQRYGDDDFRRDFSSLVAHEVERIDGIVNELLSFSKPAKPHLVPMNGQETIDQTLKLVHEQLSQKNIELQKSFKAEHADIMGDAKLLSQALVNLNLNAIDAIGQNGKIIVGTINCNYRFANGDSPDRATTKKCIRVQITDNGKGIERENLQKIFDPFFTSKSEGTGMGLSVAHGIISEHHGVIEVDSEVERGTTFYIYIPLLEEGVSG